MYIIYFVEFSILFGIENSSTKLQKDNIQRTTFNVALSLI